MSREKQIEEMAETLDEMCDLDLLADCGEKDCSKCMATGLYNAGYRRQREGEWVLIGNGNGRAIHWKCSVCGYETLDASNGDTNFCPNCGADMRGGE